MEKTANNIFQTSDLQVVVVESRFSAQGSGQSLPLSSSRLRTGRVSVGLKSLAAALSMRREVSFSCLFTQRTNSMRSGGCSSLLMPLEPLAEVAGRSRGQCMWGSSHPRVATAVRGARSGWRRRVLVARLVLLLFVEAEADVALQGRRG